MLPDSGQSNVGKKPAPCSSFSVFQDEADSLRQPLGLYNDQVPQTFVVGKVHDVTSVIQQVEKRYRLCRIKPSPCGDSRVLGDINVRPL